MVLRFFTFLIKLFLLKISTLCNVMKFLCNFLFFNFFLRKRNKINFKRMPLKSCQSKLRWHFFQIHFLSFIRFDRSFTGKWRIFSELCRFYRQRSFNTTTKKNIERGWKSGRIVDEPKSIRKLGKLRCIFMNETAMEQHLLVYYEI